MLKSTAIVLSLLLVSFSLCLGQSQEDEDVLILKDGTVVRGKIIEVIPETSVRLTTASGETRLYFWSEIEKRMRMPRGVPDSTITSTYVKKPRTLSPEDKRVLTVLGGLALPIGAFADPLQEGAGAAGTGFAVGLDAGFPVVEGFRWLTSGVYARNPMELSDGVKSLHASGKPTPTNLFWALTGIEYRSEGVTPVKFHLIVQVGGVWAQMAGFDIQVAGGPGVLPGVGTVESVSSGAVALCVGVGASIDRFSVNSRALFSMTRHKSTAKLSFYQYGTGQWSFDVDQSMHVLLFTVGVSVL